MLDELFLSHLFTLWKQGVRDPGKPSADEADRRQKALARDILAVAHAQLPPETSYDVFTDVATVIAEAHDDYLEGRLATDAFQAAVWDAVDALGYEVTHYKPQRSPDNTPTPRPASEQPPRALDKFAKRTPAIPTSPPKLAEVLQAPPTEPPTLPPATPTTSSGGDTARESDSERQYREAMARARREIEEAIQGKGPHGQASRSILSQILQVFGFPARRPDLPSTTLHTTTASREQGGVVSPAPADGTSRDAVGTTTPEQAPPNERSLVERVQLALDLAGAVEPTPFADATNAAISLARAVREPERMGEHLQRAGTSVVSAVVPYLGDLLKLPRLRAVARSAATQENRATVSQRFLRWFGGGESPAGGDGGGGPPETVPPGGGGTDGRDAGKTGADMSWFGLPRWLTRTGIAIGALIVALRGLVAWFAGAERKTNEFLEAQRRLSEYSGSLGLSYMRLDAERLLRDVRRAQAIAGPIGRLTRAQSAYEEAKEQFTIPLQQLWGDFRAVVMDVNTRILKLIDAIEPVAEWIEAWYAEDRAQQAAEIRAVREEADKAMQRMRDRLNGKGNAARRPGGLR